MKKLLYAGLGALLLTACSGGSGNGSTMPTPTPTGLTGTWEGTLTYNDGSMSQLTMVQTGSSVTATLYLYDMNAAAYAQAGSDTETLNGSAIKFTFTSGLNYKYTLAGTFSGATFSGQDTVTGNGVNINGPFNYSQISTTPPMN